MKTIRPLPIPDKGELKYPNLGSRLDELVASVEAGETTAEEAAKVTLPCIVERRLP